MLMIESETSLMLLTAAATLDPHSLTWGMFAGAVLNTLLLSWRTTPVSVVALDADLNSPQVYRVSGQLFYGSVSQFSTHFQYLLDPEQVVLDFSDAQICDPAATQAIEQVMLQYQRFNKSVSLVGLNYQSHAMIRKAGIGLQETSLQILLAASQPLQDMYQVSEI